MRKNHLCTDQFGTYYPGRENNLSKQAEGFRFWNGLQHVLYSRLSKP